MIGTIVNSLLIILGSLFGLAIRNRLPIEYQTAIVQGIAIVVGVIGVEMALQTSNVILVIISIVLGTLTGEFLKIDDIIGKIGVSVSKIITRRKKEKAQNYSTDDIAGGFISATLLYCVGAMSVVGSIQSGISGNHDLLYAKSLLDGITAVFLTASLGIGVLLSSVAVFIYQGTITVLSGYIGTFFSDFVVAELTATGGVLIIGISILMLKICELKIANMLPAILYSIIVSTLYLNYFKGI